MHGYVPAFQNDRDKKRSRVDFHTGCPTVIKKNQGEYGFFRVLIIYIICLKYIF